MFLRKFVQKERVQKKIVEFSTKVSGWGQQWIDFPLIFFFGWGDPSQLGSWSEGCVKPLKLSREAI